MEKLLADVRCCTHCAAHLPAGPRPVVQAASPARILIIGQAPGTKVHASGIPWNDPSGNLLRQWLGIDSDTFYDPQKIALIPMGFCYPGKGKSGDLPPRPECAPLWHSKLISELEDIKLTLLIGQYSQKYYLGKAAHRTLTETVKDYRSYLPQYLPLPHPSPRNRLWLRKNTWFQQVVDELPTRIASILEAPKDCK